jgi:hypothetical protein
MRSSLMKFRVLSVVFVAAVAVVLGGASSVLAQESPSIDIEMKLVTLLHCNEPYTAHVFNGGHLFVGQSNDGTRPHRLEIYADEGTRLVQTIQLPHAPVFAYAHGRDSVLVAGKSYTDQWRTHYTIISPKGAGFVAKTTTMPAQFMIDQVAGGPEGLFFAEVGDAAIIKSTVGGGYNEFAGDISGPGKMQRTPTALWAIERRSTGLGDENVIRVNTTTGVHENVFTEFNGQGITDLLYLPQSKALVANEVLTGRLWFIDEASLKIVSSIDVAADVRAIERIGHCVVASSAESQVLSLIDISELKSPKLIREWDLRNAGGGEILRHPNGLTVNPDTGTIFVRSTYICPSCTPSTQASVWTVSDRSSGAVKSCMDR